MPRFEFDQSLMLRLEGQPDGWHHQCVVSPDSRLRHERQRSYSREGKSQQ